MENKTLIKWYVCLWIKVRNIFDGGTEEKRKVCSSNLGAKNSGLRNNQKQTTLLLIGKNLTYIS